MIRGGEHSIGKIPEQYNASEEKYSVAFHAVTIIRYSSVYFIFEETTKLIIKNYTLRINTLETPVE